LQERTHGQVELDVELSWNPSRVLNRDHFEFAEFGLCEINRVLQDREWQCKHDMVGRYIGKLITDLKCERVSAIGISAQHHGAWPVTICELTLASWLTI
jgi:hypothetical protein